MCETTPENEETVSLVALLFLTLNVLYIWHLINSYRWQPLVFAHVLDAKPIYFHGCLLVRNLMPEWDVEKCC